MHFAELKSGEIFGHLTHIFQDAGILSPFTIKTNEKTKYIEINKAAFDIASNDGVTIKDYLVSIFNSKFNFFKKLKVLGDLRHSFARMLPFTARATIRKVPTNTLIVRQGEAADNIYFIKSGICKVLREITFIKPKFVDQIESMDNETLYLDPDQLFIHRKNQQKKLLQIAELSVGKFFGDHNIMENQPKEDKKMSTS